MNAQQEEHIAEVEDSSWHAQEVAERQSKLPKTWKNTRRVGDRLALAGRGNEQADVMIIATCPTEEETKEVQQLFYGKSFKIPAALLKGPSGSLITDIGLRAGMDIKQDCYYTTLVKWLPEKGRRTNPRREDINFWRTALEEEIYRVKPRIIVCLGKPVFDALYPLKFKKTELRGGFFFSEDYQCLLYPCDDVTQLVRRPELYGRFYLDFQEVARMVRMQSGDARYQPIETNYRTVTNSGELAELVAEWHQRNATLMSVDCEWQGRNHVDGKLRSVQFAWAPGEAAYIRLMDDAGNYAFDVPYASVGFLLGAWLNQPQVRYVGHHLAADFPWLKHVLGLVVYEKAYLDTEFALQCCDEFADLSLERLSLGYTDLGRYDTDLTVWKKLNKVDPDEGYGRIPDDILIPYACLRGESLVQLEDGTWEAISMLVKTKYTGKVKAVEAGRVVSRRVTNWHSCKVENQSWFRLRTRTSKSGRWGLRGPVFTPDHEVITHRGKVRVDALQVGKDRIVTDERAFGEAQLSVVIGSLLGDGGASQRNGAGYSLLFSQAPEREAYAAWKAACLETTLSLSSSRVGARGNIRYRSACSKAVAQVIDDYPRYTYEEHSKRKLRVTAKLLDRLDDLALAVWYQDDGTLTRQGAATIFCQLPDEDTVLLERWFQRKYGEGVYYSKTVRGIVFDQATTRYFLAAVTPWMHKSMSYKTNLRGVGSALSTVNNAPGELVSEPVLELVPAPVRAGCDGDTRFCLSVDGAENFLTEVGFVSNCKDVDVVIRAVPHILRYMEREQVSTYYFEVFHPFVTDVFTEFALNGLPMDVTRMDELRTVFHASRRLMEKQLRADIVDESRNLLWRRLHAAVPEQATDTFLLVENMVRDDGDIGRAFDMLKRVVGVQDLVAWSALFDHYTEAPVFNIRSVEHMRRWLFGVKGYTPIKSTKNDAQGLPSTPWDRVLELPEDRRSLFQPSVDRQSLEILAVVHSDPLIHQLLELNAVGNLCKAFLKEAEVDADGEVVKENGLHFWLASDGRVHGQMSTTETGRPRAWKPNVLNWPKWNRKQIEVGIRRTLKRAIAEGDLPAEDPLAAYLEQPVPSVRSCVTAPDGWMMVESDYATAEIRALAFISGDVDLIRLITEPDHDFGLVRIQGEPDPIPIRLRYSEESPILPEHRLPDFLMAKVSKGAVKHRFQETDLLRDDNGQLIHPSADLHWALAEHVHQKPREMLDKDKDRVAAKRGNFGAAYGIMARTLERQIEQEIGEKPPEGTGERILEALETSRPVAFAFLSALEDTPVNPGYLRAASGRKRRFALHPQNIGGISSRMRKSNISTQGREARNFHMQCVVADTAARASVWLLREYSRRGMQARPMVVLYDSVVTLCPPREKDTVAELHQQYMTDLNCWSHSGRVWNLPIDTEFNVRWSTKPTEEDLKRWSDVSLVDSVH